MRRPSRRRGRRAARARRRARAGDAHGCSEGDIRRAGRDCALPERPEARQSGLCASKLAWLRPERRDRRRACETEQQPEKAAEQTLHEGFTAHLADDEPLRPAERLQRPEPRTRFVTEESVSRLAIRNAARRPTTARAVPSLPARFFASTSEPVTRSARSFVVTDAPSTVERMRRARRPAGRSSHGRRPC